MSLIMFCHALIGTVTVCTGAMALLISKGCLLHKLCGRAFVCSMLLMGFVIFASVWFEPGSISSLGILFVLFMNYLVVSAWSSMSHIKRFSVPVAYAAPVVALCISISGVMLGIDAISSPIIEENTPPTEAYFFFAAVAFIAMLLDINNFRLKGVRGKHRIVRHIWRMTGALFFATSTLFTGPSSIVFSETIRGSLFLAAPQFIVLSLSLLWIGSLLFFKWQPFPDEKSTAKKT